MDSASLQRVWAALLPHHVVVRVGGYSTSALPGGASEAIAAATMQDSRRLEFLSGRLYARKALQALGHRGSADIPVAGDRGPLWPEGVVGSITHTLGGTGGWAAAAVCEVARFGSLGIDMECRDNFDASALEVVLTPTERAALKSAPPALRSHSAGLIWCAKEAVIKAARGTTDPGDIEIALSKSSVQFRATLRSDAPEAQGRERVFEGRASYEDGFAFAAAYR